MKAKAQAHNPDRPSPPLRKKRRFFAWSVPLWFWLTLVIATALMGGALGAFIGFISKQQGMEELEKYDPPQVTRILDRTGQQEVATFFVEKREVIPQGEMPRHLKQAFLAIEDERFRQHFGVDLEGVLRAIYTNLRKGARSQGGSTITQQLSRNVSKDIGRRRSYVRKFREAIAALLIEQRYSKDQILEFYLNQIFLGHNSYGVQAAAQTYFGKDVRQLSLAESASLAAIPKAPTLINPRSNPEKLVARRNLVIQKMMQIGMISAEKGQQALAEDLQTTHTTRPRVQHPYFIDYLRTSLNDIPEIKEDVLEMGGYQVYSTMDATYQQILEETVREHLPRVEKEWQLRKYRTENRWLTDRYRLERRYFQQRYNTLLPRRGQIRLAKITEVKENGVNVEIEGYTGFAPLRKEMERDRQGNPQWTGNYVKPWFFPEMVLKKGEYIDVYLRDVSSSNKTLDPLLYDRTHVQGAAVLIDVQSGQVLAITGGHRFYDRVNQGMYNRASSMPGRQIGSCFKPLLYAIAMQKANMTPGTIIMDQRIQYGSAQNPYVPRNYENKYYGPTTLLKALSMSNNVVTVRLLKRLGMQTALNGYYSFDMVDPKPQWDLPPELSVALGSHNVTPLSIATAYLAFARAGVVAEPTALTEITDLDLQKVYEKRPRERFVLSPQVAYLTTYMLREVVENGTGRRTIGSYFSDKDAPEMAGKTGTTTGCVDAWFVGYTPELVLAVWVGFDRSRPMGPGMTGSRVAGPIWRDVIDRVLQTRQNWQKTFNVPSGIIFRDISSRTGLIADAQNIRGDERILKEVPFIEGTEPTQKTPGFITFPFWEYQHPDPEKNEITDPENIPTYLLDTWREKIRDAGLNPESTRQNWTEEIPEETGLGHTLPPQPTQEEEQEYLVLPPL